MLQIFSSTLTTSRITFTHLPCPAPLTNPVGEESLRPEDVPEMVPVVGHKVWRGCEPEASGRTSIMIPGEEGCMSTNLR